MKEKKKFHFISIGGSVMHALAIALKNNGHHITGSDDAFFSPSKENLKNNNILPKKIGYEVNNINNEIDIVIVGMHTKKDNPELLKAQELNICIFSFPEYIAQHSKEKQRIVIAGSHGKTSIVSILTHILGYYNRSFDYVSGAINNQSNTSVILSYEAPIIIIEGDEYLSSPLDSKPKFSHYNPHILLVSGIEWDHINVYPTEEDYIYAYKELVSNLSKGTNYVYNKNDKNLSDFTNNIDESVSTFPYSDKSLKYKVKGNHTFLYNNKEEIKLNIFGKHNIKNLAGVLEICKNIGITTDMFFKAIETFPGTHKRLTRLKNNQNKTLNENNITFLDFAHAPSKVRATVSAINEQYPHHEVFSFLELHTFSSLNLEYIKHYKDSLKMSDKCYVYINQKVMAKKGEKMITENDLKMAFNDDRVVLISDIKQLELQIKESQSTDKSITLIMSSGNTDTLLENLSYSISK